MQNEKQANMYISEQKVIFVIVLKSGPERLASLELGVSKEY